MRHKLLTYTLLAGISGAVLWACQRDRFGHRDPNAVEPTMTVNEARDFFEYQFSEMAPYMTKAAEDRPVGMMPGDFTPLWDKARIGANPEMDGADVPIDPKFIFTAIFNRITPEGDTVRQTVDVTQKLVVKKWRDTSDYKAYSYIASIVPTPEYYAKHKNVGKEFQYAGGKGDFSGFVIYRTLTGRLVGVDNYKNGRHITHHYFSLITDQNADSVEMVARTSIEEVQIQGGTAMAFRMSMEEDDPCWVLTSDPVKCSAKAVCTICHKDPCECSANKRDDPEPKLDPVPVPDPKDDNSSGGSPNDNTNDENQNNNTVTVSTLFNAKGLNVSLTAEINDILKRLSELGISNKVLSQLLAKGKITLAVGQIKDHEEAFASYALQTRTLTLNTARIDGEPGRENILRNAMIEELFHAFQYQVYGSRFNQRCYEFEAKVYGTIAINQYAPNPNSVSYLNPMVGLGEAFGPNFANDIYRYTGNFTHGISSGDMNTLYQDYGGYCTQYPAGDPNWEFKAIQNAQ